MERRKHIRIAMKNLWVDVGDGLETFRAVASDVSQIGVRFSSLSKRFNEDVKQVKIVVAGKDGNFSMDAGLRWVTNEESKKSIGVEILNAPLRWTGYVMDFEALHAKAQNV